MHTKTGIHPHWDFNEQVFSSYNWKTEPSESLAELYKRRAEQIRSTYDYVVVWYSSGADSDNVLKSFLNNDILVDEVACFVNYEGMKDKNSHLMNGEIFNIAIPKIEKYKAQYPDLKFRLIDICQPTIDYYSDVKNMLNWHYSMNSIFNPNSTLRNRLYKNIEEWSRLRDSGKKICFVWGTDKPRVNLDQELNKYFFSFMDIIDNAISPDWQNDNNAGEFMECFYWTPDLPEISIKQAHIVKNYLRNATVDTRFISKDKNSLGFTVINNEKYYISNTGINWLVYPEFEFNILNEFKPSAIFWTPRDNWFYEMGENELAYTNWRTSLDALWKRVPDYWKNNPLDPKKAFKNCISKKYYIE